MSELGNIQRRIQQQAERVAHLYLEARRLDEPATREQKELIENVVATDYDGRTVVELLQNAHDAHPRNRHDGCIRVWLDPDEGLHGVLYVANGGEPFKDEDFDSICRIALSSKPPAEGIGNKGVGFKSVLQLSVEPEIYSLASAASQAFDGYCFRFARPEDFGDLARRIAPGDLGLEHELRENVSPLKVPVAIDEIPDSVGSLAGTGFVTVIRLPLRSAEAANRARSEIDLLLNSAVPVHLFLERVASITFAPQGDGHDIVLTRTATLLGAAGELMTEHVRLHDGTELVMLHSVVSESAMQSAIAASRSEGRLGSSWERWEGNARVSIALPIDEPLLAGRLFTFLPMAESAPVPLRGFVNGPFFAHLNRRDLEIDVPLNSMLLDALAHACATAVALGPDSALHLSGGHLVDLMTWKLPYLARLDAAFEAVGTTLAHQRCVPAIGERVAHTSIDDCWLWDGAMHVLTPSRIDQVCAADLVSPALHETRKTALTMVAEAHELELRPDIDTIAGWTERVARALLIAGASGDEWADFFDDVAAIFDDSPEAVATRAIIPTEGGNLASASSNGGAALFFSPQPDDDAVHVDVSPPPAIATTLQFARRDIPWNQQQGQRRVQRLGRQWLEQKRLVREYRTGPVLDAIGDAMKSAVDARLSEAALASLLIFAFSVWAAGREIADAAVRAARLFVPTRGGWRPATEAIFSPGWSEDGGRLDSLLARYMDATRELSRSVEQLEQCVLVDRGAIGMAAVDDKRFAEFLDAAGVQHGMQARWYQAKSLSLVGELLNNPRRIGRLPQLSVAADRQEQWLDVVARWPRGTASYETVDYKPASAVAVLPGPARIRPFR